MRDYYDDEPDDDFDDDRRRLSKSEHRHVIERARCAVMAPAICFLVLGGVSILYGIYQVYNVLNFDQQWEMQMQMQQANPGMPAAQKQMMQGMMDSAKGVAKGVTILAAAACNIVALFMIVTGYLLLTLRAKPFVFAGSILALLPVTYCCMGGLPLGIWTLAILSKPGVKAGFAFAQRYRREDFSPWSAEMEDKGDDGDFARRMARRRTPLPGLFLILFGIFGFLVGVTWLGVSLSQPDLGYEWMKKFADMQFTPQQRTVMLAQVEKQKDMYRLDRPLSIAGSVLGCLLCLVMVVGGIAMRRRQYYSLALAAAICAIVPLHGCSFFSLPFGLWALIVLSNFHVRRVFAISARQSQREDV